MMNGPSRATPSAGRERVIHGPWMNGEWAELTRDQVHEMHNRVDSGDFDYITELVAEEDRAIELARDRNRGLGRHARRMPRDSEGDPIPETIPHSGDRVSDDRRRELLLADWEQEWQVPHGGDPLTPEKRREVLSRAANQDADWQLPHGGDRDPVIPDDRRQALLEAWEDEHPAHRVKGGPIEDPRVPTTPWTQPRRRDTQRGGRR